MKKNNISKKVMIGIRTIKEFTVISLLRTINDYKEFEEKIKKNECILSTYEGMPVYYDFWCSIAHPVYVKIPELYEKITSNELLQLSMKDWLEVLLNLEIPVISIDITSGDPPGSPSRENLMKATQEMYSIISKNILEKYNTFKNAFEEDRIDLVKFFETFRNSIEVLLRNYIRNYKRGRDKAPAG